MQASASAPTLGGGGGGGGGRGAYARSERVERRVPLLALVPLDQLRRRTEEEIQGAEVRKARGRRKRHDHAQEDDVLRQEEQHRLGERFLGMMALLARLRRVDLEGSDSTEKKRLPGGRRRPPMDQSPAKESPSVLEKLIIEKREERSTMGGAVDVICSALSLSPHRKPEPIVNVATAPLREHLTFEISMLLPPPMDTRQSALQSPIHRKKRKKRLKRRRRKKRPTGAVIVDGKRTWQTSHVTWVPHASTDYAQARADEGFAASTGSKLVAKFAALRTREVKALSSQRTMYLYATDKMERRRRLSMHEQASEEVDDREEEDQEPEGEGRTRSSEDQAQGKEKDIQEDEEDREDEQDSDSSNHCEEDEDEIHDTLPDLLLPTSSIMEPSRPRPHTRPLQTHQAAWISPDLRSWLLDTGLFRTSTQS